MKRFLTLNDLLDYSFSSKTFGPLCIMVVPCKKMSIFIFIGKELWRHAEDMEDVGYYNRGTLSNGHDMLTWYVTSSHKPSGPDLCCRTNHRVDYEANGSKRVIITVLRRS